MDTGLPMFSSMSHEQAKVAKRRIKSFAAWETARRPSQAEAAGEEGQESLPALFPPPKQSRFPQIPLAPPSSAGDAIARAAPTPPAETAGDVVRQWSKGRRGKC